MAHFSEKQIKALLSIEALRKTSMRYVAGLENGQAHSSKQGVQCGHLHTVQSDLVDVYGGNVGVSEATWLGGNPCPFL